MIHSNTFVLATLSFRHSKKFFSFLDSVTLPETNSEFTPENGWLEDDRFLLGFGLFSGALAVSLRECNWC